MHQYSGVKKGYRPARTSRGYRSYFCRKVPAARPGVDDLHRPLPPMLVATGLAAGATTSAAAVLPLLVIFDDSLQNRWQLVTGGAHTDLSAPRDTGRLRGGRRVPCGRSISSNFNRTGQTVVFRTDAAVMLADSLPLSLSFAFNPVTAAP